MMACLLEQLEEAFDLPAPVVPQSNGGSIHRCHVGQQ